MTAIHYYFASNLAFEDQHPRTLWAFGLEGTERTYAVRCTADRNDKTCQVTLSYHQRGQTDNVLLS